MKNLVVASIVVVVAAVVLVRPEEEKYSDEFDTVDIDEILDNQRIFNSTYNCIKTGNKCTPATGKLRELLPDALKTKCRKCTEVQKRQSRKVLQWLIEKRPEVFLEFEGIYDKDHIYRKTYAEQLKEEGVVLPALPDSK